MHLDQASFISSVQYLQILGIGAVGELNNHETNSVIKILNLDLALSVNVEVQCSDDQYGHGVGVFVQRAGRSGYFGNLTRTKSLF